MRRVLPWVGGIALLLVAAVALARPPLEVLCLASAPALIPRSSTSNGWEIQNRGPNSIFIEVGGGTNSADGGCPYFPDAGLECLINKTREITAGSTWSGTGNDPMFCIAATADQVTGAATIITEAP